MAKFAINASGAMLLPSLVQVSESISGSVVPLAMFTLGPRPNVYSVPPLLGGYGPYMVYFNCLPSKMALAQRPRDVGALLLHMLLPSLVQVSESISGSVVPLAMFYDNF